MSEADLGVCYCTIFNLGAVFERTKRKQAQEAGRCSFSCKRSNYLGKMDANKTDKHPLSPACLSCGYCQLVPHCKRAMKTTWSECLDMPLTFPKIFCPSHLPPSVNTSLSPFLSYLRCQLSVGDDFGDQAPLSVAGGIVDHLLPQQLAHRHVLEAVALRDFQALCSFAAARAT